MTDLYADYDAWKEWGEPFRWSPAEGRYFAAELGRDPAGLDILELGFGGGAFLGWARDKGARVTGAEITPGAIEAAQAAGIALVPADFEAQGGLEQARYDVIAAFDVFEHLDPATIPAKLKAIARALKPGGMLLMRYPNGQSPFGLEHQHGDATHVVALSRAKMEQYARGSGLRTVRYGGAARVAAGGMRALAGAARGMLQGGLARMIHFAYGTDVELAPVVTHVMAPIEGGKA